MVPFMIHRKVFFCIYIIIIIFTVFSADSFEVTVKSKNIDQNTYYRYRNIISKCIDNKNYKFMDDEDNNCLHLISICAIRMPYSVQGNSLAIENKDIRILNLLITEKVDINAINKKGMSPLMYAVDLEKYEIANVLINNGANINQVSSYKNKINSPLSLAVIRGNYEIAELLLKHGAKVDTEICTAAALHDFPMTQLLINYGGDPKKIFERNGRTTDALHCANTFHDAVVSLLDSKKADMIVISVDNFKKVIIDHAEIEDTKIDPLIKYLLGNNKIKYDNIIYADEKMQELKYTGDIDNINMNDALTHILNKLGLSYKIKDESLLIQKLE